MEEVTSFRSDVHWTQTSACKRVAVFIALVFLFIGVARGVNFPSLWAYTHYLLPCADSFVKRTTLGCIVEVVGVKDFYRYETFVYYCFIVLIAFWLLFSLKIIATLNKGGFAVLSGVLVFCAGLAPVYLSNMSGYFDFFGAFLVIMSLFIRHFRLKFLVITFGFLFLVFVHEAIVVIFLPLAVVDLCISARDADQGRQGKRLWLVGAMGVALLSLALLVANSSIDPGTATALLNLAQQKTAIPVNSEVFDVFSRDIAENRGLLLWFYDLVTQNDGWLKNVAIYISSFLLGALVIAYLNFRMAAHMYRSRLIAIVISLAPLSALALLLVAYDIIRWAAWATACSFCLYMILCARGGAVALRGQRASRVVIMLFAVSQVAISIPLLVPREDRPVISSTLSYLHGVVTGTGAVSPDRPLY